MGLFSRNKEALEGVRGSDDVPFDALKRSPRNTRTPRASLDGSRDAPPPLDPAETAKTRARRRLIGAVALAAAAVVFVPMLFDRTPVATSDDIALSIPDRDTPFEGRRGLPDTRAPLKASADLPVATTPSSQPTLQPLPEPTSTVASEPAAKADGAFESETKAPEAKPASKAVEPAAKAAPPPAEKAKVAAVEEKPKASAPVEEKSKAPSADDPKALAALEGRGDASPAATAPGDRSYAVQIAAYSSADKAKAMRDTLVANGLRSYTESVSTTQGVRTRVRLGPFASRDAADHAKQKLKTMKLDGSVVPL